MECYKPFASQKCLFIFCFVVLFATVMFISITSFASFTPREVPVYENKVLSELEKRLLANVSAFYYLDSTVPQPLHVETHPYRCKMPVEHRQRGYKAALDAYEWLLDHVHHNRSRFGFYGDSISNLFVEELVCGLELLRYKCGDSADVYDVRFSVEHISEGAIHPYKEDVTDPGQPGLFRVILWEQNLGTVVIGLLKRWLVDAEKNNPTLFMYGPSFTLQYLNMFDVVIASAGLHYVSSERRNYRKAVQSLMTTMSKHKHAHAYFYEVLPQHFNSPNGQYELADKSSLTCSGPHNYSEYWRTGNWRNDIIYQEVVYPVVIIPLALELLPLGRFKKGLIARPISINGTKLMKNITDCTHFISSGFWMLPPLIRAV